MTYGVTGGVGTAIVGSCSKVNVWTAGLKTLINVLSTLLLGLSSYTMQCLSSPTRKDLDNAHAQGQWMDIGVSGLRNLFRIRRSRTALWWLLAFSSIPIHLLYNSTIFKNLDAEVYNVIVAPANILADRPFDHWYWLGNPDTPNRINVTMTAGQIAAIQTFRAGFSSNATAFENLTTAQCITQYAEETLSGRSDILVVAANLPDGATNEVYYMEKVDSFQEDVLPYAWMCRGNQTTTTNPKTCDATSLQEHASNWTIGGTKVQYCLSQLEHARCKMQFATYMMVAVIICNGVKIFCMFATLWQHNDPILVTIGDAISSYLQRPDELTTGRCLMTLNDIKHDPLIWGTATGRCPPPKVSMSERQRWLSAISKRRCIFSYTLFSAALIVGAVMLIVGAVIFGDAQGHHTSSAFWNIGFGSADSRTLVGNPFSNTGASGLVACVLLSNLPQTLLSFVSVAYNGLFTSMLLAQEWNEFATVRKPLRVSSPQGEQRSTQWLGLPYHYSLPLLTTTSALHLFVADSLFLVRVTVYENGEPVPGRDISQLGWSPVPLLVTIVLGTVMLIVAAGFSARRLDELMPHVGSCSVAIAAACHPKSNDEDLWARPVQWGEIHGDKGEDNIRHATFSSMSVDSLKVGCLYAG